jgi:Zn-finger nucleic acid-binding protein
MVVMDICPSCGGVWLDRGELEKLSRSEATYYESARWDDDDDDDRFGRDRDDDDDDDRFGRDRRPDERGYDQRGRGPQTQQRRRGGFLSNLFENFGGEGGD